VTRTLEVVNPATEQRIATLPLAGETEMNAAIGRASTAATGWRDISPGDRAALLRRFADAVDGAIEELAALEVANAGHVIGNARCEAGNVRDVLEYYADVTFHEPLGVVGIIVPWNFPMPIAGWGLAPALAAGNTVVMKPSELTPLTALRLAELALEAGIPEGVFEVVAGTGSEAGWRLVTHPAVRKICFTGSTAVGTRVMAGCAEQVKRVTLELGGKSANVVFADADLERAAAAAPGAVFDNAGQDCCARSRILVERRVLDEFLELLEPAVKRMVVDDPTAPASEMGPLISAAHRDRVAAYVDGAPVAFQGSAPGGAGFWFPPTVLAPIGLDAPAATEEIFGPVVAVVPFDDEADAVRIANATPYGLSGSIWTRDLGRALRMSRAIDTGALSVNSNSSVRYWTPFGGMKRSGLGRELGPDALHSFSDVKNVFISTED